MDLDRELNVLSVLVNDLHHIDNCDLRCQKAYDLHQEMRKLRLDIPDFTEDQRARFRQVAEKLLEVLTGADNEFADLFADLVVGLDIDEGDIELPPDYSKMNVHELLVYMQNIEARLQSTGSLAHPKTEEEKDLHTRYYGAQMELSRRGKEV